MATMFSFVKDPTAFGELIREARTKKELKIALGVR
jgi:hypothetical protein